MLKIFLNDNAEEQNHYSIAALLAMKEHIKRQYSKNSILVENDNHNGIKSIISIKRQNYLKIRILVHIDCDHSDKR